MIIEERRDQDSVARDTTLMMILVLSETEDTAKELQDLILTTKKTISAEDTNPTEKEETLMTWTNWTER